MIFILVVLIVLYWLGVYGIGPTYSKLDKIYCITHILLTISIIGISFLCVTYFH